MLHGAVLALLTRDEISSGEGLSLLTLSFTNTRTGRLTSVNEWISACGRISLILMPVGWGSPLPLLGRTMTLPSASLEEIFARPVAFLQFMWIVVRVLQRLQLTVESA